MKVIVERMYIARREVEVPDEASDQDLADLIPDFQPSIAEMQPDGWIIADEADDILLTDESNIDEHDC